VERIFHAGQSQQGGSIITYASAFHFDTNDGYFIQQAAAARPINFGPACGDEGSPPYPDCTPRLQGADRLVRTDLPVPVYHGNTETDIEILFGILGRQGDTPTFRYYEVAGGGHVTAHIDVEILPAGIIGPDPLFIEDLCLFPLNTTADGPVFVSNVWNAMWDNMEDQVRKGRVPPVGVQMDVDPDTGQVLHDEFGNGLGGVRLPSLEAPVATYLPSNQADPSLPPFLQQIGNLACFLASSVIPFDGDLLAELYPTHDSYVDAVSHGANELVKQGLLLHKDAAALKASAFESDIGN
jgi:hypothetical protein